MEYKVSEKDEKQIENNFTYHTPKDDQGIRYERIRLEAKLFAESLVLVCPPSRELSLALTNLENAVMWANASIARNE